MNQLVLAILAIPVVVFVLPRVLALPLVYRQVHSPESWAPIRSPLPASARAFFSEVAGPLVALGFELRGDLEIPPPTGVLSASFSAVLVDSAGTRLSAVWRSTPLGADRTLLLVTRFDDGSEIATANSRLPGVFPRLPSQTGLPLPFLDDAATLVRAHRAFVAREGGGKAPRAPDHDVVAEMREYANEFLQRQVEQGIMRQVPGGYSPTWFGAARMMMLLGWPTANVRRWLRARRGRRVLRELDVAAG
jgi:hypothetical protein